MTLDIDGALMAIAGALLFSALMCLLIPRMDSWQARRAAIKIYGKRKEQESD